ncbi:MAG: hypothetical protein AWM53_00525 [Candidatus Dichloromethanomonas elyunquensis]|nr:MAG: hypothetical protein AWM53_00525 [Candidatus Dichloromethanomonas elyunquensis]
MTDNLLADLTQVLQNAQAGPVLGVRLRDWRAAVFRTQIIMLGIKNNIGGSVYTPPSYKNSESAEIFLVWDDGKCSRAKLQKPSESNGYHWKRELEFWRMASFEDPFAVRIPHPAKLPEVAVASDEIRSIIEGADRTAFDHQEKILSSRPREAQTGANITALWGKNSIYTSTGINIDYEESRYTVSWSFDSLIARGYAKRRLITGHEWQDIWNESASRYEIFKKQAEPVGQNTCVILSPSVVEQMTEQYILPNFSGENIFEGQSKFTLEDFRQKRKVFYEGISLEIDPLRPYHWSSYLLTPEGVPASRTILASQGSLHSPYLNTKYALRWETSPTAIPYGGGGIKITQEQQVSWAQMLKEIDDGVLVLSVLGLHTQNPVTGSFSLAVPSGLRIKNGCLAGGVNVRISGNYWEILQSPDLVCGTSDLDNSPYFLTGCRCENI